MASRASGSQDALPQQPWSSRSHVAIFVRCLHLLDLDLLEDWPGVTEQLFTAKVAQQNLQQRVKAVEWSLYRLFEIYDPDETKDKLRPFFPPATQLQSLNLRAALYRCLTELKKNGVLGKDALLRKTMLDDCKGERVEEILASFAMGTLRRKSHLLMSTTREPLSNLEILSFILAYRTSLQGDLQTRQKANVRGRQELGRLAALEANLQVRLKEVKTSFMKTDVRKQDELSSLVNSNWVGNNDWTGVVLHGMSGKHVLDESEYPVPVSKSQNLLQDLDDRIKQHQDRLSEWRVVAHDLKSQKDQRIPTKDLREDQPFQEPTISSRFPRHKSLNLAGWVPDETEHNLDESYSRLISAMNDDLTAQSCPAKSTKAKRLVSSMPTLVQSETTTALTPSILPDLMLDQQADSGEIMSSEVRSASVVGSRRNSLPASSTQVSDLPSPLQSSDEDSPWMPRQQDNKDTVEGGSMHKLSSSPVARNASIPPSSPSKVWMSLADRTRASMSFTDRHSILTDPDSPTSPETENDNGKTAPELHLSSDDDRLDTLVERTRKSMLLFSQSSSSRPRKAKTEKRISQAFPINQFGTSSGTQRYSGAPDASGASTPRDELFDEDAEYASVFKSRPKLALSPAFSPQRRTSGLNSILEKDLEQLNLDSDGSD